MPASASASSARLRAGAPSGTGRTIVIIPAKDEEAALPGVLADLAATVPDLDVVVVDDGSTDRTAELARAGGAVVLSLPFNLGIGGALRTGFRYASREGYERGVQFDADGQHDSSQIAALLRALDDGADMAIGNRFGGESHSYQVGRVRAQAMGLMRFVVRQFSGQRFTDTSSGFRAFGRDVLVFFARDYPADYMESVEALLLASASGFRIDEVPVRMHNREQGTPSNRRFKLLYHYVRLLLVITVSVSGRRRVARAAANREAARTPADNTGDGAAAEAAAPAPIERASVKPAPVAPATRSEARADTIRTDTIEADTIEADTIDDIDLSDGDVGAGRRRVPSEPGGNPP